MRFLSKILLAVALSTLLLFSTAYAAGSTSEGTSSSDIIKLSGDIYVNEGNNVDGGVVTMKGNIYINGTVTKDAVAVFGNIYVNGQVLGDAVTVTGKIILGEKGKVLGDTVEALGGAGSGWNSRGGRYIPNINPWGRVTSIIFSFFGALGLFLLGALVYLIMPRKVDEMADSIDSNFGRKLGIGILTIMASPIAMIILSILLAITIIGIIIIPFAWLAFLLALFVSVIPVYLYIGKRAAAAVSRPGLKGFGAIAAGMLTLWVIRTAASFGGMFTGWISFVIYFVIFSLGLGTLLEYIFSNNNKRPVYSNYQPQGGTYNPYNQAPPSGYVPREEVSRTTNMEEETPKENSDISKDENR